VSEKINRDVDEILKRPEISTKLREFMLEPAGGTRAAAAKFFADEAELWGKVIRETNLTPQ
jgi:tripartite-type tricarboxylate transporter receptor subunit TctC